MPPYLSRLSLTLLVSLAALPAPASAQGPQRRTPGQVGIDYPIVACRMPRRDRQDKEHFPDVMNFSLYVDRGTDLVLIHPDGREEVIVETGETGAVVDPVVSFDGRTIFYAKFEDPQNFNTQRKLTRSPAHIWRYDLATGTSTQITFGQKPRFEDTAHRIDPRYAQIDLAPVELADGRLLFLSNRDASMNVAEQLISMRFYRMERDGSCIEPLEVVSTQGACMHPVILQDGRIVWTHYHPAGRRETNGNFPLFVGNPDMSHIETFAGAHHQRAAYHFATQLGNGDVVTTVYYQENNFGHGTLMRLPIDGNPQGNDFTPASPLDEPYSSFPRNMHFLRVGQDAITRWTFDSDPNDDQAAPELPGGSRAGKCTMAAGAPAGHMLFVWSDGAVNALDRPVRGMPHMKVAFARNASLPQRDDLVVLKESSAYHYLYPKPLVPYERIHGIPRPAWIPDTANDGAAHPVLPAGTPFATTGTSSVYNRESAWPAAFRDDWDINARATYSQSTAHFHVGQDSFRFEDGEIYAAQIVADMTRVDTRYETLRTRFLSHNKDQIWGILGEVPLRKREGGQLVTDPQGNPDTSYEVRVPSGVPFHHRLIDRNGLMLTAENTWHSARPGERKNECGGCHAHSNQKQYLPFSSTAAARPSYVVQDLALQTPMLTQNAGVPEFRVHAEKIRLVEYYRDIKPIFDAKCASCHPSTGTQLPDLASPRAYEKLAFDDKLLVGDHQATRWVRKNSAAQSLLVWKVFGRRLDGRTNATRTGDVDYTGQAMPPPGQPQLTFDEQRLIAAWVDLGCLTNVEQNQSPVSSVWDDQAYPVLALSSPASGWSDQPLREIVVGVYDLHSGIDPDSLEVSFGRSVGSISAGQNLAAGIRVSDGDVVRIPLSPPLFDVRDLPLLVSVRDRAGNRSRREWTLQLTNEARFPALLGSEGFDLNVIADVESSNTTEHDPYATARVGTTARLVLTLPGARDRGLPSGTPLAVFLAPNLLAAPYRVLEAVSQPGGSLAPYLLIGPPSWLPVADGIGLGGPADPSFVDPGYPSRRELPLPIPASLHLLGGGRVYLQAFALAPTAGWLSNPIALQVDL